MAKPPRPPSAPGGAESAASADIYTPLRLNRAVRSLLEGEIPALWLEGRFPICRGPARLYEPRGEYRVPASWACCTDVCARLARNLLIRRERLRAMPRPPWH